MIFIECKPDFVLVNLLGIAGRDIRHAGNKSGVCKRLMKGSNENGLVDEDPLANSPPYIDGLSFLESQYGIKILNDKKRANYLIVICPRLEDWVLKAAREARINIRSYDLPDDAEGLHRVINVNIDKFEKLIKNLKGKSRMLEALQEKILILSSKNS